MTTKQKRFTTYKSLSPVLTTQTTALCGLREIERSRYDIFLIDDHGLIMSDSVVTVNISRDTVILEEGGRSIFFCLLALVENILDIYTTLMGSHKSPGNGCLGRGALLCAALVSLGIYFLFNGLENSQNQTGLKC